MEITENQEFKDISKTGKDRKWKERKLQNIEYAKRLEILGYKAFANAYQCAEVLKFKELEGQLRLLKEIRKELQLEDVENGDLVHVDEDNDDTTLGTEIVAIWNWERKNYFV